MCSKETQIATSMVWLDFYIITVVGYCGADLKALCTEAALLALRRRYPQIYQSSEKLQIDVASISINAQDFQLAMHSIIPASQRCVASPGKALGCHIRPLLQNLLSIALDALNKVFPVGSAQATSQDSKSKLSDKSKMSLIIVLRKREGPSVLKSTVLLVNKVKQGQCDIAWSIWIDETDYYCCV